MYKNVVFIDFDGPLYPKRVFLMEENKGIVPPQKCKDLNLYPLINYWKMDSMAVAMLNNMGEYYDSIFVISSSWSEIHQRSELQNLLAENGFTGVIHDDWSLDLNNDLSRAERIKLWLDNHPEFSKYYLIIDDKVSAPEMVHSELMLDYGLDPERIFLVSTENGILMGDYHRMVEKLYRKFN